MKRLQLEQISTIIDLFEHKKTILKWLCTTNLCYASILTNEHEFYELQNEHFHCENSIQSVKRQMLRKNCKRKVRGTISIRPVKIIRTELATSKDSEIVHRDIRIVRKEVHQYILKYLSGLCYKYQCINL